MAVAFLIAFIWAVKSGQYEDTYTPSVRILFDDAEIKEVENSKEIQKKTGKGKKEKTEAVPL
jgi:cbb3-type cytochrome oxidase maturation protein